MSYQGLGRELNVSRRRGHIGVDVERDRDSRDILHSYKVIQTQQSPVWVYLVPISLLSALVALSSISIPFRNSTPHTTTLHHVSDNMGMRYLGADTSPTTTSPLKPFALFFFRSAPHLIDEILRFSGTLRVWMCVEETG